MLTTGAEPPVTDPATPADAVADVDAGELALPPLDLDQPRSAPTPSPASPQPTSEDAEPTSMSWWTRAWVALLVTIAVAVVATGVVLVRRALDHTVDPLSLQQVSTTRLDALDPALPGLTVAGPDVTGILDCEAQVCASAARTFSAPPGTTAAAVSTLASTWATQWGLGSKGQVAPTEIGCGVLGYSPVRTRVCELASYDVPGQTGQQVEVFAALAPGPGAGSSPGAFPVADIGRRLVTTVYVQVLTSLPSS